jgi:hydroxyethylthiazole kinase-like uncharacterized protein yjeF
MDSAMKELLTAAQMKASETAAIESGAVTGLELMERAGRGVVEAIFETWPELAKTDHRAVVLCGPGNNGGDGFVIARLLRDWGWEVAVFLYGDAEKLPPDARANYERWREMGEVQPFDAGAFSLQAGAGAPAAVFVDAVFGTGLTRPFDLFPAVCEALAAQTARPRVIAVDVPSGMCADSGFLLGGVQPERLADLTVSFHTEKVGHRLGNAQELCGRVVVADIGLSDAPDPAAVTLLDRADVVAAGLRKAASHKYGHGHALILSGPAGHTGAARLAARGALRIGAGLVTVACPPDALAEHAAQLNAVMLMDVADAGVLSKKLEDARLNGLCLGPALGLGDRTRELVFAALAPQRATVLDADALTVFENDPKALFAALHENCVLTPHGGEFRRLFPDIAEKLDETPGKGPAYSKVDATRAAAARAGCVVLFKGPDTVIAAPDGRCSVGSAYYDRAAPWLATAGSGDVLSGFITGLLARGFGPMQAAEAAVWLHVECALNFGPGLIAEDLPEQLPVVFRERLPL